MAGDGRSNNKPSHEAQVKGGQNSHSGSSTQEKSSGGSSGESKDGRSNNKPTPEASAKGGQRSHSGK